MKIALCLSGLTRQYEKGYEYHKKNLLDHYDVDVFVHSWRPISEEDRNKINVLYKPKTVWTSDTFPAESFKQYEHLAPKGWPAKNVFHMLYSVFSANQIKKQYELTHSMEYDFVVRSRFDFALNITPNFEEAKKGCVYVPNDYVKGHIPPNGLICNDQFAYGDSKTMDLYSNTFWTMNLGIEHGSPVVGEDLLSVNLQLYKLVYDKMVYIDMNHPFPPGKYNNTPHSLLRD